jgi:hypothetical protein
LIYHDGGKTKSKYLDPTFSQSAIKLDIPAAISPASGLNATLIFFFQSNSEPTGVKVVESPGLEAVSATVSASKAAPGEAESGAASDYRKYELTVELETATASTPGSDYAIDLRLLYENGFIPVKVTGIYPPPPTPTLRATPKPPLTPKPRRVLTAADVGLPWNPADVPGRVAILPCYLFSASVFHAGDGFYFPSGDSDTKFQVVAPAEGLIVQANRTNDAIGWGIIVRTPFEVDGKTVYYDVAHTSGLVSGLRPGMYVCKGDPLAVKQKDKLDPVNWWLVDIGFRNGHVQANATLPDWTGMGYFSYSRLIQDDLALLSPDQFEVLPICEGNPIQQSKPYATPTPGGSHIRRESGEGLSDVCRC